MRQCRHRLGVGYNQNSLRECTCNHRTITNVTIATTATLGTTSTTIVTVAACQCDKLSRFTVRKSETVTRETVDPAGVMDSCGHVREKTQNARIGRLGILAFKRNLGLIPSGNHYERLIVALAARVEGCKPLDPKPWSMKHPAQAMP